MGRFKKRRRDFNHDVTLYWYIFWRITYEKKQNNSRYYNGFSSDLPVMIRDNRCFFERFEIPYEIFLTSAPRTPDLMASYSRGAYRRGIKIIIVGAGGAIHLPPV